jgi:hypothetical protein
VWIQRRSSVTRSLPAGMSHSTTGRRNRSHDFAGTAADGLANPYDTRALSNGKHSITAVLRSSGSSSTLLTAATGWPSPSARTDPALHHNLDLRWFTSAPARGTVRKQSNRLVIREEPDHDCRGVACCGSAKGEPGQNSSSGQASIEPWILVVRWRSGSTRRGTELRPIGLAVEIAGRPAERLVLGRNRSASSWSMRWQ